MRKAIALLFAPVFLFALLLAVVPTGSAGHMVARPSDKWAGRVVVTGTVHFAIIGDYGSAGQPELDVSNLVRSWSPEFIVTTGDNNYPDGATSTIDPNIGQYYHDFIFPYVGGYGAGADINRFFPSLGNHDWVTAGAQPYIDYFALPSNERYYDFSRGPVHFYAVDSDVNEPDGITSTSVQAQWLSGRLAASTEPWKLVYMHHPPYSSSGNTTSLRWPYQAWGASIVFAGHAHNYERVVLSGFPYIVNGLGGRSLDSFGTPINGSVVRYNGNYGAMLVDAADTSITFQLINRLGALIDTYTLNAPAPSPSPTRTVTLTATRTRTPTRTSTPTQLPTASPTPSHTITPVSTATEISTPTQTPVSEPALVGHVTWQGRPAQPHNLQQMPITLTLKLGETETNYPTETTDAGGYFTVSLAGLPAGTYDWRAKGPMFLANAGTVRMEVLQMGRIQTSNLQTFQLSDLPTTSLEIGLMVAGDATDDNTIDVLDFNLLKGAFGWSVGDPSFDGRADFSGDGTIDVLDFNLLKGSFGSSGAPPLAPVRPREGGS
jgi:tartrate-resistant acid phosphatase type 5